jgi:hypothetical protein
VRDVLAHALANPESRLSTDECLVIPNPAKKAIAHKARSYTDAMANPQALASSR